jgi:superfamily I DNA/RNA helicase
MFMVEYAAEVKALLRAAVEIQSASKGLDRGSLFLPDRKGLPEERRELYCELLRDLQLWASVYTKSSLKDGQAPSNIARYYKTLREECQLEFPENP